MTKHATESPRAMVMGSARNCERGPDCPVTILSPQSSWADLNVREIWQASDLLLIFAWRDIKIRYKQTVLGVAWALVQPLSMMIVFSLFLGSAASAGGVPYPVFVYAGLSLWTLFATAVMNASNSVVESERLLTKVYFPRPVLPLAAVLAALIDFAVTSTMLVLLCVLYRVSPGWGVLLAPIVVAITLIGAVGVGMLFAALNVAYRDFRYVVPFLLQVGMLSTPAIYLTDDSTSGVGRLLSSANPLSWMILSYRRAVLEGVFPGRELAISALLAACCLVVGFVYFRRAESTFADVI